MDAVPVSYKGTSWILDTTAQISSLSNFAPGRQSGFGHHISKYQYRNSLINMRIERHVFAQGNRNSLCLSDQNKSFPDMNTHPAQRKPAMFPCALINPCSFSLPRSSSSTSFQPCRALVSYDT